MPLVGELGEGDRLSLLRTPVLVLAELDLGLDRVGDLLGGAGIASQSISLDGLSQSFNTTSSSTSAGYGARLIQYEKEIKAGLPKLRSYFHPIALHVG